MVARATDTRALAQQKIFIRRAWRSVVLLRDGASAGQLRPAVKRVSAAPFLIPPRRRPQPGAWFTEGRRKISATSPALTPWR